MRGEKGDLDRAPFGDLSGQCPAVPREIQKPSRLANANRWTPVRRDTPRRVADADAVHLPSDALADHDPVGPRRFIPPYHGDASSAVFPKAHPERRLLNLGSAERDTHLGCRHSKTYP